MSGAPPGRYVHRRVNAPCCGPFAIHVCTGLPYELVISAMQPFLGKRASWQGGAHPEELLRTLDALGVSYEPFELANRTVIEAAWYCDKTLPVLMHIPQHYVTMYQSRVIDQVEARIPPNHWCKFKYIKEAWQILTPPSHTEEELI